MGIPPLSPTREEFRELAGPNLVKLPGNVLAARPSR